MGNTNFPFGVTSFGIPLPTFGGNGAIKTGNYFFVDSGPSTAGDVFNKGTKSEPFLTVDFAVGRCTANNGDVIIVMPGHNENLSGADGVDLDVAGISVIGIGNGQNRPGFDHDATASEWVIGAADIYIENIWFRPGANAITNAINIEAAGDRFEIVNCQFGLGEAASDEFADAIIVEAGADDGYIHHCKFESGTQLAVSCIELNGAVIGIRIEDNYMTGDYSVALIRGDTTLSQDVVIRRNLLVNGVTGGLNTQPVIDMVSITTTGYITDNDIFCNLTAPHLAIVATGCLLSGNRYNENLYTTTSFSGGLINADAVPASSLITQGINPMGHTYYVAASGGTDGVIPAGLDPQFPLATIAQAITNGVAGDTVYLGPGTHTVDISTATLTPLADMQFIGAIPSYGGTYPSTIITADADDTAVGLFTINVDGCLFKDIQFLQVATGGTHIHSIDITTSAAVQGLTFIDCCFNMNDVSAASLVSISAVHATLVVDGLTIKHCRFTGGANTVGILRYMDIGVAGCDNMLIEDCVFECESADADGSAIVWADPAGIKSYGIVLRWNIFIGPKDGGLDGNALEFNSSMNENEILGAIVFNHFCGFGAVPIGINLVSGSMSWNYFSDTSVGGVIVNPGT